MRIVRPVGAHFPSGRNLRLRGAGGQEGGNQGFPLLVNQPPSFRARCARKSKSLFPPAARLVGQGKQNRCHPWGRARNARPYEIWTQYLARRGRRALRRGVVTALLVAWSKWATETLVLRTFAREARPKGKVGD